MGIVSIASPARALTINAMFDASVTGLANAATVEAAFNVAAATYASAFTSPVTVNIKVGWGNVGGQAMPANAAGASQTAVTGFWTYAQMRGYLAPSVSLPATQKGPPWFVMATAEGKALGLVAAKSTALDGSVGFNNSLTYDFNPAGGITAGSFDFVGIAEHEIAEVLGRNSSISSNGARFYQMPIDLFRYSAPGVQSYSYSGAAYLSIDGGVTNSGAWNNAAGGGDRADWLTGGGGRYPNDVQNAYVSPGATTLSAVNLDLLAALGWSTPVAGPTRSPSGTVGLIAGAAGAAGIDPGIAPGIGSGSGIAPGGAPDNNEIDTLDIRMPEPTALMMLPVGLAGIVLTRRKRSGT